MAEPEYNEELEQVKGEYEEATKHLEDSAALVREANAKYLQSENGESKDEAYLQQGLTLIALKEMMVEFTRTRDKYNQILKRLGLPADDQLN